MKPLVAIAVGHSRQINGKTEGGAVSVGKVSEWTYNADLAKRIQEDLSDKGIRSVIYSRYQGNGYTAAQKWLAAQLKDIGATLAIELHFNSSDSPSATGHEWLHYQTSTNGKRLAESLDQSFRVAFPVLRPRGVKSPESGRGDAFLKLTHCPAIIAEPFFGSNPKDWKMAEDEKGAISASIAQGIVNYLG